MSVRNGNEGIDEDGRLAPLDGLGMTRQDASDDKSQDDLPAPEENPTELVRQDGKTRQARNRPQHASKKGVEDESIGHHVRVDHPDPAGGQELDAGEGVMSEELHGEQESPRQADKEPHQAGDNVVPDEGQVDQGALAGPRRRRRRRVGRGTVGHSGLLLGKETPRFSIRDAT
jgi:hypothetical protein